MLIRYKFLVECTIRTDKSPPSSSQTSAAIHNALRAIQTGRPKYALFDTVVVTEQPKPIEERVAELEARLDRLNEDPDY